MIFSTKAEYGVRLLVALGRSGQERPIPLAELAEADSLPLSYLEHLAAKLKASGLIVSQRGARGGYRLGRPAADIKMLEVVEVLEGPIAPMECFEPDSDGRVLCSHETDGDHACATKLLWMRVHGGITKALAGTTLEELIEFEPGQAQPTGGAPAPAETTAAA